MEKKEKMYEAVVDHSKLRNKKHVELQNVSKHVNSVKEFLKNIKK